MNTSTIIKHPPSKSQKIIKIKVKKIIDDSPQVNDITTNISTDITDVAQTYNCDVKYPTPILKWIGGKTQIIHHLLQEFPLEINNYHDVFVGGGSVLLAFLFCVKQGYIKQHGITYASDLNYALIYLYKHLQTSPALLHDTALSHISTLLKCPDIKDKSLRKPATYDDALLSREAYYYWCRNNYNNTKNDNTIARSALFLFLNKTCFLLIFALII